jgi:Holliday junction resolvase-like predicted endonuclease
MRSNIPAGPDQEEPLSKLHFGLRIEAEAAKWYLERNPAARLLERGFRWRGGEIDLIFEEPSILRPSCTELVFVEVRARLPGAWESGVESVRGVKLARLRAGITVFLSRYRGRAHSARLDLIAWDGTNWEHLKDAAPET